MDNRDFDMRKIPGIEAMLASGVPESCSLAHPWEEIEGLRQQLDAALQERDEWRATAERLDRAVQLGEGHFLTLIREKALQDENSRLRAALERYGRHESGPAGCRYEGRGFGGAPCTCGLSALLEVKETPGSEEPPGQ